jgi:uncharacterized protein
MSASDRLVLRIEDAGLAARLHIGAGPALSRADAEAALRASLAAMRVGAGLDEAALAHAIEALVGDAAVGDEIVVARGRAPREGERDRLELDEPLGPVAGTLREDQTLDYRERRLIVPVDAGASLGRIVPGRPAEAGFDVFGAVLDAKEADPFELRHGEGIVCDADGTLRATRAGARSADKQGVLDVVDLHVHAAAVDLASGNLATEGSLQIARDVASGMHVHAGADLVIKGTVESARIDAGGSIVIGGGVIGGAAEPGEAGRVYAGGDLTLRHALGARLVCGGTLRVQRSVATSRLQAREIVIDGAMLGDSAEAETRIRVRDAGSPAGGPCHLRAAHPLELPSSGQSEEEAARLRALTRLSRHGDPLSARKARDTRKGRGERRNITPAPELGQQWLFRRRQRELQTDARIEIEGTGHPGCRIDFGGRPLVLEVSVTGRVFRFDPERDEIVAEEK